MNLPEQPSLIDFNSQIERIMANNVPDWPVFVPNRQKGFTWQLFRSYYGESFYKVCVWIKKKSVLR